MVRYPIQFVFNQPVSVAGAWVHVHAQGRALAVQDDEEGWWLYGVTPGGVAQGGKTQAEAHELFRNSFALVLFEIAEDVSTWEAFRVEVERFFQETNPETEKQWKAAVEEVREGRIQLANLPRKSADEAPAVVVTLLENTKENYVPTETALAA